MSLTEQRVGIPHHQAGMGFKYKHGWIPLTEDEAYNQQLHKSIQKANKAHRPKGKGLRPEDAIDAGTAQYQKDAKLLPAAEKYRKLAAKHRDLAANAKTAHQREMALMRAKALEGAVAKLEEKAKASSFKLRNDEARYDISPLGAGKNWVTEVGGLPTMARAVAHALIRSGHSESTAIATAIAALKRWAAGGGNVHPSTRARAAAAVAHWEASKLAAHASRQDDTAAKEHRALAILERRVGPHGFIHGWIKVSGDALKEHLVEAHGADRGKVENADDRRLESAHSGFHRHMRESVPAHSHTHSHSSGLNTTTHTHHMVGLAPSKSGRMSRHELIHKHGDLPLHIHEA